MKHNRIISIVTISGLAVIFFMLMMTSPTEIGPFGVLLFFTTLYIAIFGLACLALQAFSYFALRKESLKNKDYLYSAVIAFGPIMMLMARSFGTVDILTIALIVIFLILAEFLVYKKA